MRPDILVTGAAGFIGSKVAEQLLASGAHVTGLDDLHDGPDLRLREWRLETLLSSPSFAFHQVDISDKDHLEQIFTDRFKGVINLAARAGVLPSVQDPLTYVNTNLIGTLNVLQRCVETDTTKFVLASSSSVYGSTNSIPFREDANTDRPSSPYATSKKAAEMLAYNYHHLHHIDVTILRYFTVYGPAGRPDMSIFRFVRSIAEGLPLQVYGDGQQSRDYTHVDDIANGTIAALRPAGYDIVNLGSDNPATVLQSIRIIEQILDKEATIEYQDRHPADVPATWADITKARTLLRWEPETSFQDGLKSVVKWYEENRDWAKELVA